MCVCVSASASLSRSLSLAPVTCLCLCLSLPLSLVSVSCLRLCPCPSKENDFRALPPSVRRKTREEAVEATQTERTVTDRVLESDSMRLLVARKAPILCQGGGRGGGRCKVCVSSHAASRCQLRGRRRRRRRRRSKLTGTHEPREFT